MSGSDNVIHSGHSGVAPTAGLELPYRGESNVTFVKR